jgi:hypothetical protein
MAASGSAWSSFAKSTSLACLPYIAARLRHATSALCYGSRGGGAQLAFHHQPGAYDTDTLISALEGLRRALGGKKATLLWDGLPTVAA